MNTTAKRIFSGITILVLALGISSLFGQSKEQIERFKREREAYFTEELQLTEAEGKAFWPLYNDFYNRKMKIVEDERNTYSYAHKNADNLSDQEILETLAKAHNLKKELLKLEEEYYQHKFMKVLPAKKVLKLGKVEWDFRRHLMRELRGHGKRNDEQSKGKGGGRQGGNDGAPPLLPEQDLWF